MPAGESGGGAQDPGSTSTSASLLLWKEASEENEVLRLGTAEAVGTGVMEAITVTAAMVIAGTATAALDTALGCTAIPTTDIRITTPITTPMLMVTILTADTRIRM